MTSGSGNRSDWEVIGDVLGEGGQSKVYLVRNPKRLKARKNAIDQILSFNPWAVVMADTRAEKTGEFAAAIAEYGRAESPEEFGALKEFKFRDDQQQAISRLEQEVQMLSEGLPGLPRLLDFNISERWMVTEYFPNGTLESNFSKYKGDPRRALKAFLSLLKTVTTLHERGIIHRDIKPANVFVRHDDELVLGDFGLVFLPNQPNRLTRTDESVGPHDYMPPWADVNGRLAEVHSNFDVYMLGKLLWCMVAGRLWLQREYYYRPENDLNVLFRDDPATYMANSILKQCIVETEKECKISASGLGALVWTYVRMLERGGQLLQVGIPRPCRVCGHGHYQNEGYAAIRPSIPKDTPAGLQLWIGGSEVTTLPVFPFVCDSCGHVEFFTKPAPKPFASNTEQ
jgi:serine/threonine protein kinase